MSSSLLRTRFPALARVAASSPRSAINSRPVISRYASSATPRHYTPPQYSLGERFQKFVPVEAYPLICAVIFMTTFGVTFMYKAFLAIPGDLRLLPSRYNSEGKQKEVWED